MKYLLFILLFAMSVGQAQEQDSIASHRAEVAGWKLYFKGEHLSAKQKFHDAFVLDSTNALAKIGLLNTISNDELLDNYLSLVNDAPKDLRYSGLMLDLMMMKKIPDTIINMMRLYDEDYIRLVARLTDTVFNVYDEDGELRQTGEYRNGIAQGTWRKYGYQGKLHHSFDFLKGDTVIIKYYKPDGEVFREVWTTGMPFTNESERFKEIVYWQEKPGRDKEYLYVSKEGFKIYDLHHPVVLDHTTPDNIIKMRWNAETLQQEAVIWKNGKTEPFPYCPEDGTVVTYMEDGEKKSFRWQDCEKKQLKE